jgi:hypothetical protein
LSLVLLRRWLLLLGWRLLKLAMRLLYRLLVSSSLLRP